MSVQKLIAKTLGTAVVLAAASAASADVVVLNFENIAPYPSANNVLVQDFYNGGTSSIGTSGTNYGVNISDTGLLICLNTPGTFCSNTSRGGQGDPNSQLGGLFFLSGSETFMNVAAGFDTGFSFFYTAISQGGAIQVFDGLNGTGNLLATLNLSTTASACDGTYGAAFCPFVAAGVAFSGVAKSVSFGGVANQIVFDDITFGSVTPGNPGVPEPTTWAMMIGGLALTGAALRRRRKDAAIA